MSPLRKRITVRSGHILGHFDSVELAADFAQRIGQAKTAQLPHDEATALPEIDFSGEAKSVIDCATMCVHYFGAPTVAKGFQKYKLPSLLHRNVRELDAASSLLRHPGASLKVLAALKSWLDTKPQPRLDYNESLIAPTLSSSAISVPKLSGDAEGKLGTQPSFTSVSSVPKLPCDAGGNLGVHTLASSASSVPKLSGDADGNFGAHAFSSPASSMTKLPGDAGGNLGAHTLSLSASSVPKISGDAGRNVGTHSLSSSTVPKLSGDADGILGIQSSSTSTSSVPKLSGDAGGKLGEIALSSSASSVPTLSGEADGNLGAHTLSSSSSSVPKISREADGNMGAHALSLSASSVPRLFGKADGNMGAHTLSSSASLVPKLTGEADGNTGAHTLSSSASSAPKLSGEADENSGAHILSSSASSVPKLSGEVGGKMGAHTLSLSASSVPKLSGEADGNMGAHTLSSSASSVPKPSGVDYGNLGARTLSSSASSMPKLSGKGDGNLGAPPLSSSASSVPKLSGEADGNMGAHTLSSAASSMPILSGEADGNMGAHALSLSASSVPPLSGDPSGDLGTNTLSSSTSSVPKLPGNADGHTEALTFSSSTSSVPKFYGEAEGNLGDVLARLVVLEREMRALSLDTDNKITASGHSLVATARQIAEWCTCKVEKAASSFSASVQTEVRRGNDTLIDCTVTRFHDLLHSQIDQVTSKLTELVTDRCNELSERIGSLAVNSSLPPNVADSHYGQDSSWNEAGTQDQAAIPDIGAFTAENLSDLTGMQTLAIGRCKTPGEAEDVIRRARTPCSYFFSGSCKFGERCAFFHGDGGDGGDVNGEPVPQELHQKFGGGEKPGQDCDSEGGEIVCGGSSGRDRPDREIEELRLSFVGLTKKEIQDEIDEWRLTFTAQGISKNEIKQETEYQALLLELASRREKKKKKKKKVDTAGTDFFPMDAGEEKNELRIGDTVEVHGLKTAKRLNGSRGVVTSINDDMRYGVLLYGDTESKAIKLENLEKLSSMGS